jgi:predicted nucleotidyltransferase
MVASFGWFARIIAGPRGQVPVGRSEAWRFVVETTAEAYNPPMKRERIVRTLQRHERALRARGARALYLFGSAARDEAGGKSDVDLFMDRYRNRKFGLVDLVGLRLYAEKILGRKVDLFSRAGLHRALRRRIEAGAVRIF